MGTQSAPPNQVLVGIALFLTIFVMAPTFTQIKKDAIDPLQKHQITQAQAFDRGQEPLREFMFRQTRTTRPRPLREARARSRTSRRARTSRPTS